MYICLNWGLSWGRIAAALNIDSELSSVVSLTILTGSEGSLPHLERLHQDLVAGGLLLGAALSAGGQLAAVSQTWTIMSIQMMFLCQPFFFFTSMDSIQADDICNEIK